MGGLGLAVKGKVAVLEDPAYGGVVAVGGVDRRVAARAYTAADADGRA